MPCAESTRISIWQECLIPTYIYMPLKQNRGGKMWKNWAPVYYECLSTKKQHVSVCVSAGNVSFIAHAH